MLNPAVAPLKAPTEHAVSQALSKGFAALERNPSLEIFVKEVIGINAPRIALARSATEMFDVAVSETGNTLGFFGIGYGLDALLKQVYKKTATNTHGMSWSHLGKSYALFSVLFAWMWAMPFFRNAITAQKTGKTNFKDVIQGAHQSGKTGSNANTQDDAPEKTAEAFYRKGSIGMGLGILGALLAIALTRGRASSGKPLGKMAQLFNKLTVENGSFAKLKDIHALLFWGLPAYVGWMQAARDKYEYKEWVLKFASFAFCFFVPKQIMKRVFQPKFEALLGKQVPATFEAIERTLAKAPEKKQAALALWRKQNVWGMLSSLVLLGISPAVLNRYLTQKRLERDAQTAVSFSGLIPSGNLSKKSFRDFVSPAL